MSRSSITRALIEAAQAGDRTATGEIVKQSEPLIKKVLARRQNLQAADYEDLAQEARMEIFQTAIPRFRHSSDDNEETGGVKFVPGAKAEDRPPAQFETFATWRVRARVRAATRTERRVLPETEENASPGLSPASKKTSVRRFVSGDMEALSSGASERAKRQFSMSTPIKAGRSRRLSGGRALLGTSSDEDTLAMADLREQIETCLAHLSDEEQTIIKMRHLEGRTLREIEEISRSGSSTLKPMSRDKVQYVENRALQHLRSILKAESDSEA